MENYCKNNYDYDMCKAGVRCNCMDDPTDCMNYEFDKARAESTEGCIQYHEELDRQAKENLGIE